MCSWTKEIVFSREHIDVSNPTYPNIMDFKKLLSSFWRLNPGSCSQNQVNMRVQN